MKTIPPFLLAITAAVATSVGSPLRDVILSAPESPPLGARYLPLPDHPGFNEDEEFFGYSIAVAGDYAFFGSPVGEEFAGTTQASNPGSVYVYRRFGSSWSVWQVLQPHDIRTPLGFGWDLEVSEDGRTLVVGVRNLQDAATRVGGAYVFEIDPVSGRFGFVQKLVPPGVGVGWTEGIGGIGPAVAISGDWIVATGPEVDNGRGAAFLFHRDRQGPGGWSFRQEVQQSPLVSHLFGTRVEIDGEDLVVAGYDDNVYPYRLDAGGTWISEGILSPPGGSVSGFGDNLDVVDGRLIVSHFRGLSQPTPSPVFVFERGAGGWVAAADQLSADPDLIFPDTNKLQTFESSRRIQMAGDIVLLDGYGFEADKVTRSNDLRLGEILTREGGGFVSRVVLGDIIKQSPVPSGAADPLETRYDPQSIATDGKTALVMFYAEGDPDSYKTLIAAIAPGAPEGDVVGSIRAQMFYQDAAPTEENAAAFAYQRRMYSGSAATGFTSSFNLVDLYGDANRASAERAEARLRLAYPDADPVLASQLEDLFLDLAYGRAAAELILSRDVLSRLQRERLLGAGAASFFLDTEIDRVTEALDYSAAALGVYLELFEDDLGILPAGGISTGRRIFAEQVPGRELEPARDITGASVNGSEAPLLPGYKDLVLLKEILLQHTRSAAQLAYLLVSRNGTTDADAARDLIGDIGRLVFEQRLLVDGLFPDLTPTEAAELGLTQLAAGIDVALGELAAFAQNLDGTINLFGYEPDFLLLIHSDGSGFNSFDNFRARLDPVTNPGSSQLALALGARTLALGDIDSYESKLDVLEAEWAKVANSSNGAIIPRLIEIVGVAPPDVLPAPDDHPYASPQTNIGSDIEQQFRAIDQARLRILSNGVQISNLREEINIERQRRAVEAGINSSLSDAIIDFGNQRASITQEISRIEAAQAASENLAEITAIDKLNPVTVGIVVVNAAVQTGAELDKGNLEASKDRLAATEAAAIRDADDDILDNNSEALIKTLLLEMNTLNVDSQQAALLLRQEIGRLVALVCEKADLERRLDEVREGLGARYFADPIHRLRALDSTLAATQRFEETRKWLFFMARALEYKWNQPFVWGSDSPPDDDWGIDDLYKLRNADELSRFYTALIHYNDGVGINRQTDIQNDFFSIREDYFGYRERGYKDGQLVDLEYDVINPSTGQLETGVGAITAFRYALRGMLGNWDADPNQEICLRFDTVRRNGLELDAEGNVQYGELFDPANYLDRIDTVQVFIPGAHQFLNADSGLNTVGVQVAYAGTSYIRTPDPGNPAPMRPDLLVGEMTSYPAISYRLEQATFGMKQVQRFIGETLRQNTADAVKLPRGFALTEAAANTLGSTISGNIIDTFRERAVATTSWTIELEPFLTENSNSRLVIDEIDDVVLYFKHRWVQR